jgi:hypothetical protein
LTPSFTDRVPTIAYIEDDVDRYRPDEELILKLYDEADSLLQQQAPACP